MDSPPAGSHGTGAADGEQRGDRRQSPAGHVQEVCDRVSQRAALPARVQALLRRRPDGRSLRVRREHVSSFRQKRGEGSASAAGVTPRPAASDPLCSVFQDNTIDFLEFVAALNLVFRGDLEHKLRWSFKVYDKDGNGYVEKEELRSIVDVSPGNLSAPPGMLMTQNPLLLVLEHLSGEEELQERHGRLPVHAGRGCGPNITGRGQRRRR